MAFKIYLVRHGMTDHGVKNYTTGHKDIALNEIGKKQAQATAEYLEDKEISKIFASSLSRASETAKIIALKLGLSVEEHDEFMERSAGKLDGVPFTEFFDAFKKVGDFEQMMVQAGGEPSEKFKERVWSKFLEIIQNNEDHKNILIVAHGGVCQFLLLRILESNLGAGIYQGNCCINIIEYDNERDDKFDFIIALVNYTDHLG
ncbi:MAG: histidine phosphatase family protein [Promethearchaeota archaeon]|jgi:broad specificity phosphatase PhoE